MMRRILVPILVCALATVPLPGVAHAEPSAEDVDTAKQAVKQGRELRAKGDHRGALEKFRAAWALVPTPVTGIELARTCLALDMLVDARETALAVLKFPTLPNEKKEWVAARTEADTIVSDLKDRIPRVTIQIEGVPPSESPRVVLDGKEVNATTLAVPRSMNPGKHELIVSAAKCVTQKVEFAIQAGESRVVSVKLAPTEAPTPEPTAKVEPTPAPPPTSESPSPSPRESPMSAAGAGAAAPPADRGGTYRLAGLVAFGGGLAVVGVGTIMALSARSDYLGAPGCDDANRCTRAGFDARNDAITRGNTASWIVGIGAAVAVTGVVVWATARPAPQRVGIHGVRVGATGIILDGAF